MKKAFVHIVGAGPGDPDLLTVKAARLIANADAVVYDKLVSTAILEMIPNNAKSIYVGKASGHHLIPQSDINQLLVDLCAEHRNVVRLKGGDPLIFGRGSEEALTLHDHGIPFQIVPGITAASACSTYAGIPLTHRGLANSVTFITGHFATDKTLKLNKDNLKNPNCTLVFYMGVSSKEEIVDQLIKAGRAPDTPAAIIEKGTTDQQRRIVSTLANLVNASNAQCISAPAVLVVGDVVSLAAKLSWFDSASCNTDRFV